MYRSTILHEDNIQYKTSELSLQARQVDQLVLAITDVQSQIDSADCKVLENQLELSRLHELVNGMEEQGKVLMDESRAIIIQYNATTGVGDSTGNRNNDGMHSSLVSTPITPHKVEELYAEQSQLYTDMEILYNKAIYIQTKGVERLHDIKNKQALEIQQQSLIKSHIVELEGLSTGLQSQLQEARDSLQEWNDRLLDWSHNVEKQVSTCLCTTLRV